MAPFPLESILGHWGAYLIYLLIGIAFGAVLEMAGFGNSRKLAGQFYFTDQTVLKVMFTAIVVAMVLIFWSAGLGILDYWQIWVNPTYLWPGIVGGILMGFGFIIGGFCPGTSLVAVATLKIDGIFFALGVAFGIFLFGESVSAFEGFFNSSFLGRFTLPEWLGLDTGVVVTLIVLMALGMFWGAEYLERRIGGRAPTGAPRARLAGAALLFAGAAALMVVGQPTLEDRWNTVAAEKAPLLQERQVQIHPGELAGLMDNDQLNVHLLDLREERYFNLFHLRDAERTDPARLKAVADRLLAEPPNTVTVLMGSGEAAATDAWRILTALNVPNVYLLDGGLNHWLDVYGHADHASCPTTVAESEAFRHNFEQALGGRHPTAEPPEHPGEILQFTPKVKVVSNTSSRKGGCG